MTLMSTCKDCGEDLENILGHEESDRCSLCAVCLFCGSDFTATKLTKDGSIVQRRCLKCDAYTERYLTPQ